MSLVRVNNFIFFLYKREIWTRVASNQFGLFARGAVKLSINLSLFLIFINLLLYDYNFSKIEYKMQIVELKIECKLIKCKIKNKNCLRVCNLMINTKRRRLWIYASQASPRWRLRCELKEELTPGDNLNSVRARYGSRALIVIKVIPADFAISSPFL